jgi:hypothetical protein
VRGIAAQISERAQDNAWREDVADTITVDALEEAFDEGLEAWAAQHAEVGAMCNR